MRFVNSSAWALIAALYLSQYIGIGFISVALIALLRAQEASLAQLSMVSLLMLPYGLKFIWAPAIDKYQLRALGSQHYKNWLLVAQSSMLIAYIVVAFINPMDSLSTLVIILTCLMFAISTQDIAIDGLACLLFQKTDRSRVNAIQLIASMLGNLLGGGLVLLLYNQLQWQGSIAMLAIITALAIIPIWHLEEPQTPVNHVKNAVLGRLWHFWYRKKRWLLFLVLYPVACSSGFSMVAPALVDHGWVLSDIGKAMKIYGSVIGLVSALASGWIIRRLGCKKTICILTFLQGLGLLALLPLSTGDDNAVWVYIAITLNFACFSPIVAALFTIGMNFASEYTPATDCALQNSVFMLNGFLGASLGLMAAQYVGYQITLFASITSVIIISYFSSHLIQYD